MMGVRDVLTGYVIVVNVVEEGKRRWTREKERSFGDWIER
jgi:hypothetical protein